MHHDITLISTMAISLVYALVGGYIASRLRLPPLVGYLIAGIVVGPFTPGFVADRKLAPQLAEIGVILLMFGVGLHFSIRDLLAVRKIAVPGALVQIALSVALTCGLTHFWGWPFGPSLVLGLALSVASTVVVVTRRRRVSQQNPMLASTAPVSIAGMTRRGIARMFLKPGR